MFHVRHAVLSVDWGFVVTCWERANLLAVFFICHLGVSNIQKVNEERSFEYFCFFFIIIIEDSKRIIC